MEAVLEAAQELAESIGFVWRREAQRFPQKDTSVLWLAAGAVGLGRDGRGGDEVKVSHERTVNVCYTAGVIFRFSRALVGLGVGVAGVPLAATPHSSPSRLPARPVPFALPLVVGEPAGVVDGFAAADVSFVGGECAAWGGDRAAGRASASPLRGSPLALLLSRAHLMPPLAPPPSDRRGQAGH